MVRLFKYSARWAVPTQPLSRPVVPGGFQKEQRLRWRRDHGGLWAEGQEEHIPKVMGLYSGPCAAHRRPYYRVALWPPGVAFRRVHAYDALTVRSPDANKERDYPMSATPRHVSTAVGLVIAGAMRDVDNGTGLSATDVYFAVLRELKDWTEGEEELGRLLAEDIVSFFGGHATWPTETEEK